MKDIQDGIADGDLELKFETPPESLVDKANALSFEMYRYGFGKGGEHFYPYHQEIHDMLMKLPTRIIVIQTERSQRGEWINDTSGDDND